MQATSIVMNKPTNERANSGRRRGARRQCGQVKWNMARVHDIKWYLLEQILLLHLRERNRKALLLTICARCLCVDTFQRGLQLVLLQSSKHGVMTTTTIAAREGRERKKNY